MSRTRRLIEPRATPRRKDLLDRLVDELKTDRDGGQPMIQEEEFPSTGLLRVTVFWDDWNSTPDEARTLTIFDAYRRAEGAEYAKRITLASGLTIPEAYAMGMLPHQVVPFVRPDDPVTMEQCQAAMLAEGASKLLDPDRPPLRFPTEDEAASCIDRLTARLPGSRSVWGVVKDVFTVDQARLHE